MLSQLSAISTLRFLNITDPYQYFARRPRLAVIAALFGRPAVFTSSISTTSAPRLSVESLVVRLSLFNAQHVDAALEGIGCHIDPATCRQIGLRFGIGSQDNSDPDYDEDAALAAISITAQHLRHLRPAAQPPERPFYITAAPLSAACMAAIDQYERQRAGGASAASTSVGLQRAVDADGRS